MFSFRWTRFLASDGEGMMHPAAYFASLPVLETDHLVLRPLRRRDANDIFSYASDPEVARYVLWDPHQSVSETRSYIRYMRSLSRRGLPSSWAVTLRDSGKVIGTIGFMWYSTENRSAELGYSFSREYWNRGYGTSLAETLLRMAKASGLSRTVEAITDPDNVFSKRILQKAGFALVKRYTNDDGSPAELYRKEL